MAGVELASDGVRVVVGRSAAGRLQVSGRSHVALAPGAATAGVVTDPRAAATAIATALDAAERGQRSERVLLAIDGDDIRTYHGTTTFEREDQESAVSPGEALRALRQAREEAARNARLGASDDPALRGVATAELRGGAGSFTLDGRTLASLVGHRGRYVEVRVDIALAPLVLTGAATAALDAARRRGGLTCGAYALGRLIAGAGATDTGVLRITADLCAGALVRDARVMATRAFALGRDALVARGGTAADAAVWARCVLAAFAEEEQLPARWLIAGMPVELAALPRALAEALSGRRGGAADVGPLRPSDAAGIAGDAALGAEDLVAAGAAALAAEGYA